MYKPVGEPRRPDESPNLSTHPVIAGLDPAIHPMTFVHRKASPIWGVSAWIPWSSHGMTELRKGKRPAFSSQAMHSKARESALAVVSAGSHVLP
ncbi:hypothetical protein FIV06_05760 [Labrenzia sp. THAF191b]|nr:hypothetical protein FIV06_05760 [Labrenzia sp. THAF191b]QFT03229.1 hypothetical protein FIV05_05760 [Labrenzia sp. THAF191a]QFT14771.1 hypothetical protein FIV03_05765 [Labrenzia sp. THAF187b]